MSSKVRNEGSREIPLAELPDEALDNIAGGATGAFHKGGNTLPNPFPLGPGGKYGKVGWGGTSHWPK